MNPQGKSAAPLNTPVALFIFNRPIPTAKVLAAIAEARPARVLVVADGPREDHPDDARLCAETRALIDSVNWPCEVQTHYSGSNLGCQRRVASGLDWVFSQVDEAIILEDDCLPDPSFFPFCEELLARYRNDEKVHMVRGGNFLGGRRVTASSYYFTRAYHIWGWATWARAWKHNDVTMRGWPELRNSGWLERHLPTELMVGKAREIFDQAYAGQLDTWEYYWVFSGWVRNALAISPVNNLVTNIGFGPGAAHYQDKDHPHSKMPVVSVKFPLRHPRTVEVLEAAELLEWTLLNPRNSFWRRVYGRLLRFP